MRDLSFVPLSTFADIAMGQSPPAESCNTDDKGLPFLQGCAEFGQRNPSTPISCSPPLRIAKAGAILISVRAPVGTMNYADQDYCIGRGLAAFNAKPGHGNSIFLKHAVEQNVGSLHRRSQGSTFAAVSSSDVRTLLIPYFTSDDQEALAAIFSTIDTAIETTEALIEKYKQIKAGLMHDLFTRGVLPNGQLRPPREEAPALYRETAIGWIPNEWDLVRVETLCSDIVDCPHTTPIYETSGVPCIRTADMLPGELLLDDAFRVSERTYRDRIERLAPRAGDIIYSREGERLGIASPVGAERICLGQRVMLLRAAQGTSGAFLMWAMNMPTFYRQVLKGLGATTSPHVNVGDIRRLFVAKPGTQEQVTIGSLIGKAHAKLGAETVLRRKLIHQKLGLMQDLLTGKVPVKVAAAEMEPA